MEKLKVYLDTNTIIDFFINAARSVKSKSQMKLPQKYQFFASNTELVEFTTSILTKAEIARELVSALGMTKDDVEPVWKEFIERLNCKFIEEFDFDARILDVVYAVQMKLRTMLNIIHLFIAMDKNNFLLTGDKDLIKLSKESGLYDKILSYVEFRQMLDASY